MAYTFRHGDRPLDRLTIQRAVGRGGFGEVYYAVYDSGKQVAAKYLRENPEVELRGISQVMNLKSPHLITIYDVQHNAENEPFVIMEYVSGPSLRELLTAEPDGMGPQKAAFFLQGIAAGLSYLHDRGIVHRDLKPGNIFYDDGYVKIGDYGLSKHIAMSAHSGNTVSVGTVHYMAPEIGSGSYSKAIDIYALGVILFELLTGRLPYTGSSMGEILMRHLNDRPDLVGIPEPFRSVIARALDKDPARRYQDVNEMVDAITSVQEISDSIASFNPASLAGAQRYPDATDAAQTQTSPGRGGPRPVAPLDARAMDFPPIPPIPAMPGERPARRHEREPQPAARGNKRKCTTRFLGQAAIVAIIVTAVGLLIGATTRRMPESGVSLAMMLGGAMFGALFAHFKLLQFLPLRHGIVERILYGSAAAVGMLPGLGLATEEVRGDFPGLFVALAAVMVAFNWHDRIERGRRREHEHGFWMPAVVGLIGAAIATDGDYPLQGAALGAALALLMPMAAAIFAHRSGPGPDERLVQRAASYDRPATPPPPPPPPVHRRPVQPPQAAATPPVPPAPPPAPPAEQSGSHTAPRELSAAQPSFVGRAANAGLAFLAKSLIVIGFVWALGFQFQVEVPGGYVGLSGVQIVDKYNSASVNVPRFVVMIPFVLGLLLLVTARRADGVWHFLRGIVGCGLGMLAAGVALGPAAEPLRLIFRDQLDALHSSHNGPLVLVVALTVVAVTLVFWPKKSPHRTIVV